MSVLDYEAATPPASGALHGMTQSSRRREHATFGMAWQILVGSQPSGSLAVLGLFNMFRLINPGSRLAPFAHDVA